MSDANAIASAVHQGQGKFPLDELVFISGDRHTGFLQDHGLSQGIQCGRAVTGGKKVINVTKHLVKRAGIVLVTIGHAIETPALVTVNQSVNLCHGGAIRPTHAHTRRPAATLAAHGKFHGRPCLFQVGANVFGHLFRASPTNPGQMGVFLGTGETLNVSVKRLLRGLLIGGSLCGGLFFGQRNGECGGLFHLIDKLTGAAKIHALDKLDQCERIRPHAAVIFAALGGLVMAQHGRAVMGKAELIACSQVNAGRVGFTIIKGDRDFGFEIPASGVSHGHGQRLGFKLAKTEELICRPCVRLGPEHLHRHRAADKPGGQLGLLCCCFELFHGDDSCAHDCLS